MPRLSIVIGLAGTILLGACSSGSKGGAPAVSPLAAITDLKAHTDTRIKAINRVNQAVADGEISQPAAREALKRAAWSRGSWWKVRIAAIEALIAQQDQIDDTRNMLRLMLPTETQGDVTKFICTYAADHGWTDLTQSIVRHWSRPDKGIPDAQRPERAALAKLYPDRSVEETVFVTFVELPAGQGKDADRQERIRMDAWGLLCRIDTAGRTTQLLSGAPNSTDPLIATLQRAARELRCIPDTGDELAWVQRLGEAKNAAYWSSASSAVQKLGEEQVKHLRLRHLAPILWAESVHPEWLSASRADLLAQLGKALSGRSHRYRANESSGAVGRGTGETIDHWGEIMSWGDVLTALIGSEIVLQKELQADLFTEATSDQGDTSTEYGGVIVGSGQAGDAACKAVLFPPRASERYSDKQFVPSLDMVEAGDTALFHYHFHVNVWENGGFAGPSGGDIDSALQLGRACLVFTGIEKGLLNADYYQGNGAVIDLGNIKRP